MKQNALLHKQLDQVSPSTRKEVTWSADIIDKIDRICRAKGISQRELARKIGCSETQISRWTRGFPNFTLHSLAKLSVALEEDLITV
jgi:ribosome-binding protein aMBF1 (putative translation factor)